MRRIRYLTILLLILGAISMQGQNNFDPASPDEPAPPGGTATKLSLVAVPSEGGTVNGAGWYDKGTKVTVRAYNQQNYAFDRWTNEQGVTLSTSSQFAYEKQAGSETLTAHFVFSPGSPAEPSEIARQVYYRLTVRSSEGGTASGGGRYLPDTRVYLSASVSNNDYRFVGWYNSGGEKLSGSTGFYYVTTIADETITARFELKPFDPSSPSEPSVPTFPVVMPKHKVTVTATEGGTVNTSGSTLEEGKSISLSASSNANYVFSGWYVADTLYSKQWYTTYTMGTTDVTIEARFVFNPTNPTDPLQPTTKKYALYVMSNTVTYPGADAKIPLYLTSLDELHDFNIQLTFDKHLVPSPDDIELSERAEGYEVRAQAINDSVYTYYLTGGRIADGTNTLMTLRVHVGEDVGTRQSYPIKINQVAVTESDGTETTASTRNGRVTVYKLGDTNGDDTVNALDVLNMSKAAVNKKTEVFIREVSDINEDRTINALDVLGVVKIVVNKE